MIAHQHIVAHAASRLSSVPPSMIAYALWLDLIEHIPVWELVIMWLFNIALVIYLIGKFTGKSHAFEKIKFRRKDLEAGFKDSLYFEITIPKNSQTTAFQVQQKILKAFHAIYIDPVEGAHNFGSYFYFFQKLWRFWKVYRSQQIFFTMQIWAQHPYISFRLQLPRLDFERVEKAIFNAYPNAEITMLDKSKALEEIKQFPKGFLSYGETTIEGQFYHRVKTLKDVSSDPVDSIISTMEGLQKGQFMAYNILISPSSHYFNQIIHYLIEDQEQQGTMDQNGKRFAIQKFGSGSELANATNSAMIEKKESPAVPNNSFLLGSGRYQGAGRK